jgi:MYXO-CTERM domain-containing protein
MHRPLLFLAAIVAWSGLGGTARAESPVEVGPRYPTLSLEEVRVLEGTGGPNTAAARVRLSEPWTDTVMVEVLAFPGSATAADFALAPTRLTFLAGETVKMVTFSITADALPEEDETFTLALSAPVNAAFANGQATVTIADDDRGPPSRIDIEGTRVREGDTGSTAASVLVKLTPANLLALKVKWRLEDDPTGRGGAGPPTGELTFAPGETAKRIDLTILGDTDWEPDQRIAVVLFEPTVAGTLGTARAEVVVENDDAPVGLTVADVMVTEGHDGARPVGMIVQLSRPAPEGLTVLWGAVQGTAAPEVDYRNELKDSIKFTRGETSRVVPLTVLGDRLPECNEGVVLTFQGAYGGDETRKEARLLIVDDDGEPGVGCGDPYAAQTPQVDPPAPVTHDGGTPTPTGPLHDAGSSAEPHASARGSCAIGKGSGSGAGMVLMVVAVAALFLRRRRS